MRGIFFHSLQGFWYRFLVDAKIWQVEKYARKPNRSADKETYPLVPPPETGGGGNMDAPPSRTGKGAGGLGHISSEAIRRAIREVLKVEV